MQDVMTEINTDVIGKFKMSEFVEYLELDEKLARKFWRALRRKEVIQKKNNQFYVDGNL